MQYSSITQPLLFVMCFGTPGDGIISRAEYVYSADTTVDVHRVVAARARTRSGVGSCPPRYVSTLHNLKTFVLNDTETV